MFRHGDPNKPPYPIASELVQSRGVEGEDLVITKRHWSAFGGTDLEKHLREDGIKLAGSMSGLA